MCDAPTSQSNCSICEQGHITLHNDMNTLSNGRVVKFWYYLCDSCGSEYVDSDLMSKNLDEIQWQRSIEWLDKDMPYSPPEESNIRITTGVIKAN